MAEPSDELVEAGAKALFEHFHGEHSMYGTTYTWPAPKHHLPWWRNAARAVLTATDADLWTEKCWRHYYEHREYVCTCDPPVQGDTGFDSTTERTET